MQAIDQVINSAAKSFYMSAGSVKVPIVFRGPNGAAAGKRKLNHLLRLESIMHGGVKRNSQHVGTMDKLCRQHQLTLASAQHAYTRHCSNSFIA